MKIPLEKVLIWIAQHLTRRQMCALALLLLAFAMSGVAAVTATYRKRALRFSAGRGLPLSAFFIACGIVACGPNVNLSAVQQYATMAQQARASFDAIADDYDASCERQRELVVRASDLTWLPPIPGLQIIATASPAPKIPHPAVTPFFGPQAQEFCVVTADFEHYPLGAVSSDWKRANDTLLTYIQSLGAIASVDVKPSAVPNLSGAAVAAHLIPSPAATAIASFGTAIFNYWQATAKERDITSFLEATNKADPITHLTPFAEVITALEVAGSTYTGTLLFNECSETEDLYSTALKELSSSDIPQNDGLIRMRAYRLRAKWSVDLAACANRQALGRAYLAALQKISDTNDELVKAERQPRGSRTALLHDINDLSGVVSALYTLVSQSLPAKLKII
jgi:hypothetical protein